MRHPYQKPIGPQRERRPRKNLEAQLEQQGDDFLALDGWRRIITDPKRLRGLGVTEKGIPDRLYIRYANDFPGAKALINQAAQSSADVLWIEWKRKGSKAAEHQCTWHVLERRRGALVWLAGVDFTADWESFLKFYRGSGLLRREGL